MFTAHINHLPRSVQSFDHFLNSFVVQNILEPYVFLDQNLYGAVAVEFVMPIDAEVDFHWRSWKIIVIHALSLFHFPSQKSLKYLRWGPSSAAHSHPKWLLMLFSFNPPVSAFSQKRL